MSKLYTPTEIDQLQQDLPHLTQIIEWLKNFLAKPHPDLGRPGKVCPFVPQSLKQNAIRLTVIRTINLQPEQVEDIVKSYRDIFLDIEPLEGDKAQNKAILLVFPDVDIEDVSKMIDGVQQKLKLFFVESGLMIGEFHKRNETPGLHNPNFRPLCSPIPMLAIRYMVESDLPFLQRISDNPHLRIKYLQSYLQRFENSFKDENNLKTALQALALAQEEVKKNYLEKIVKELELAMLQVHAQD